MAGRNERWDRDRFQFERERDRYDDRSRYDDDDDARSYTRRSSPPVRYREEPRRRPAYDDDYVSRERRYYDEEPRFARRPPSPRREEFERRFMMEKERIRSPSPRRPQRPGTLLRRQSSLDTFDRRPRGFHDREEYGPPARREDYRPQPYVPIPLPRTRALPPPRRYEHMDEIRVSDPDYYGDDDYHTYPERVREREVVRTRRRERSRSRTRSHHGSHHGSTIRSSSRSSSTTSSSSSRTTTTVKSEYPKKGKTRIPAKLVSKRAIIDLGYPFEEEGTTIIIQRALGQENIDDLLKLSEEYKKSEVEVTAARSEAGEIIEERRREEVWTVPPPAPVTVVVPEPAPAPPPPAPATVVAEEPPVVVNAAPPPPPAPVVPPVINTTTTMVVRDTSPARSTATYSSYTTDSTRTPVIVDAGPRGYREVSDEMSIGPVALVDRRHRRHRSHSRGDLVRAERLSDGQLVIYEERVEKIEEPRRGVRIEKDKKGPPPALMRAMLATLT